MGKIKLVALGLAAALAASACGASSSVSSGRVALRLGYFPNITHATALVGVDRGIFARALGSSVTLRTSTFTAGPAAVEALFSGALDAAYLGPSPAINAFVKSHGQAIRIVSGATSGGAALVVKPSITAPAQLRGKTLASPQLGNTQDVALRTWLAGQGLRTDTSGGGDVRILPQENSQTLESFTSGRIDGAWVPEPWVSRLVQEGGGRVLVDERDLWPGGRFATTLLVVRTGFLRQHRAAVGRLVAGQVQANDFVNRHPAEAQQVANRAIARITGKQLPAAVVAAAWGHLTFTDDPLASSLATSARHAQSVGLLGPADLAGIDDLSLLNAALKGAGEPEVPGS
jgi:NitT/TauT family transport system substrate-binding protein